MPTPRNAPRMSPQPPGESAPDNLPAPAQAVEVEITGRIERRLLAAGSKSEHQGEVLVGDDGAAWTLRRQGGPAFGDAVLAGLAGQRLRACGRIRGALLLLKSWSVLD